MIFSEQTYRLMYAALQEAEKALEDNEVPVGAVVVKDNKIIGRGYNQVERLKDAPSNRHSPIWFDAAVKAIISACAVASFNLSTWL